MSGRGRCTTKVLRHRGAHRAPQQDDKWQSLSRLRRQFPLHKGICFAGHRKRKQVDCPTVPKQKKEPGLLLTLFVFALPIFPGSHPPSIVGVHELNFCVRDGNRWTLMTINTNYTLKAFAFNTLYTLPFTAQQTSEAFASGSDER